MGSFCEVKTALSLKFKEAVRKDSFNEFLKNSRLILAQVKTNDVRNIVEVTIREVLVALIESKADVTLLERVFQFSIDAALHDSAPGNLPVLVIGDMFESSTIVECETYFSFVESRVEIFKKDIFFKQCKNHLLRSCNDLLKRLSRSQNTVFCGRILMFLAHIFPLSERSGLNIISEFNLENTTAYTTNDDVFSDLSSEKDATEDGEISTPNPTSFVVDKNLYQKFWSLQDFFRSPTTCYNKMQWRQFVTCTIDILTVFGSFKSDDANSSKWKQAKMPTPNGSCVYFAKYLTSPKLLELELSDSHFRRYVLVQFLILFQYLSSPVKFKLESYVLTEEQQSWVKEISKKIYKLLEETPPNGETFARDVEKILLREEFWNAWKNEGCPDFKQLTDKAEVEKRLKKRPGDDLHTYPSKKANSQANLGTTKIWNTTPNNWEACRTAKRNFVPSLESFFGISSGVSSMQKKDLSDGKYTWKALRLLWMKSPLFFSSTTTPSKSVAEYLESMVPRVAKEKPQTQQDIMTVDTAVAEDETIEDPNDEFFQASEEDSKEEVKKENVLTKTLIETISVKLQDHWQPLALKLGFQDDEVEYYESALPDSKAQTEQMLTVWMERDGSLPTFTEILQSAGLLDSVLSLIVP